jgi:hypothetical protein
MNYDRSQSCWSIKYETMTVSKTQSQCLNSSHRGLERFDALLHNLCIMNYVFSFVTAH